MNNHSIQPNYRPDIDGLRAIAILAVVIFHFFPTFLNGGYVGVDVFFVISGFLISSIVFNSLSIKKFNLINFYSNRINRIFPALFTVIAMSSIIGWYVLFADEYRNLGRHIVGGSGFISNLLYMREFEYFNKVAETKPLLHLWSLGVEGQFYLIWPIFLIVAWKKKINFLFLIVALAIVSFLISINLFKNDAKLIFYSPQTRFWELLIGALIAYCKNQHEKNVFELSRRVKSILSTLGCCLVMFGIAIAKKDNRFSGLEVLFPVIGTALIIYSGLNAMPNKTILSKPIFVWFGLISYPLYLWHWTLLSFARIINGETLSVNISLIIIIASIILSWLTYKYIEEPIRAGGRYISSLVLVVAMILLTTFGFYIFSTDGVIHRNINKNLTKSVFDTPFGLSRVDDESCKVKLNLRSRLSESDICKTNSRNPKILFIGDSHAIAFYSGIFLGSFTAVPSMLLASHGCVNCLEHASEGLEITKTIVSIDTVVIAQQEAESVFNYGNALLIEGLLKAGKTVIFAVDVPTFKYNPKDCEKRLSFVTPKKCSIKKSDFLKSRINYDKSIEKLKLTNPSMKIFDATILFCNTFTCEAKDEVNYLFQDTHHLSIYGSEKVLDLLFNETSNFR